MCWNVSRIFWIFHSNASHSHEIFKISGKHSSTYQSQNHFCVIQRLNLYLSFIRSTLIEIGQYNLWLGQDTNNVNTIWFKNYVKRTLTDLFIQEWHSKISKDSIFTSYRIFKTEFKQEPYIKILPKNCAIEIFRFRTTNSQLPVNSQRYLAIERHNRLCRKCHLEEIGDEYHYLLKCPYFHNKRKELLEKQYYERPNTLQLHKLLNCTSKQILLKLKHFVSVISKELKT